MDVKIALKRDPRKGDEHGPRLKRRKVETKVEDVIEGLVVKEEEKDADSDGCGGGQVKSETGDDDGEDEEEEEDEDEDQAHNEHAAEAAEHEGRIDVEIPDQVPRRRLRRSRSDQKKGIAKEEAAVESTVTSREDEAEKITDQGGEEEVEIGEKEEEEVQKADEDDGSEDDHSEGAPPASYEFDVAPAPPVRLSGLKSLWSNPITQAGAFRRAMYDPVLALATVPAQWMQDDDPDDDSTINVCGVDYKIPPLFDDDAACKAVERDLERAEMKFRSARRERNVGGEIGTVIVKRKPPPKIKKPVVVVPPPPKKPEKAKEKKTATPKKVAAKRKTAKETKAEREQQALARLREKKKAAEERSKRELDKKWKPIWRSIAKTDVPKAARQLTTQVQTSSKQCRTMAFSCAKEVRRRALKLARAGDDAPKRNRRLLKDVVAYWRREEKERAEQKKRLTIELENQRKKDAEEREAQRQKNKLKFLLGQSEAFSSFLRKDQTAAPTSDQKDFVDIDGTETEADIQRGAEAGALALVQEHRARLEEFDKQTQDTRRKANGFRHEDHAKDMEDEEPEEPEKPVDRSAMEITQPTLLIGKMKEYQLRGLAWLVSLYDQGINGMLADEMGLGKTIQTISFLAYLSEKENNWGPFLVVTPKATLHNWQQEINKFCPSFRVLPYWGSKNDRQELRKHWSVKRMYHRDAEFHVCVTSYETLRTDERHFPRVKWQYLVLDEAQAIKNSSSSRWKILLNFPCRNRLLLTGTPLQNKMSELWSLLHFIMPSIFDSHAEFSDWFAKDIEGHAKNNSMLDSQTVKRLRILLDPFMLRRVKRDVENEMPPKYETELPCELSPRQRMLYAAIKSNISVEELIRSIGGSGTDKGGEERGQLMNIVMELRKVCNHPETFERRHAGSPYQFQSLPPPPHLPLPPSVLNTSTTQPAMEVTLVTRSSILYSLPRLVEDLEDEISIRDRYLREKFTIWEPKQVQEGMQSGFLSALRLCGISFEQMYMIMTTWDPMWFWHKFVQVEQELLLRRQKVFGTVGKARQLLEVTGMRAERLPTLLLPGRESPVAMAEMSTRLLKAARVFIPPAASPVMRPFVAGSTAINRRNRETDRFFYPNLPNRGSGLCIPEWYETWREISGDYGLYMDLSPVFLPDAGRLVADSGKMKLLDKLLRKLKTEGHRCLIYSQFTRVLDILEDYCAIASYKFLRLDGQSALADRRDMVAEWQTNDDLFVFLLSTRAGGVGINLTAADTVVFYDSDWNPTMDAQAMDRAHRLGQERPVNVYRLVSRGTIEERIRARARQKDRINDLVIRGGAVDVTTEDTSNEPELSDVATLLLGEEDINLKAMLAGGDQVKKTIESDEALRARILGENPETMVQ